MIGIKNKNNRRVMECDVLSTFWECILSYYVIMYINRSLNRRLGRATTSIRIFDRNSKYVHRINYSVVRLHRAFVLLQPAPLSCIGKDGFWKIYRRDLWCGRDLHTAVAGLAGLWVGGWGAYAVMACARA